MSEETPEQKSDLELTRARKLLDELGEYWDNIQLFANRHDGETTRLHIGRGNMYARLGHVRDWLAIEDEKTREAAREDYRSDNE